MPERPNAAPEWRWVPRFEHLLIDQTRQNAQTVAGTVAARLAQIAMMAAFRDLQPSRRAMTSAALHRTWHQQSVAIPRGDKAY